MLYCEIEILFCETKHIYCDILSIKAKRWVHKMYEKHNIFTNTNIKIKCYRDALRSKLTKRITQTFLCQPTVHQGDMICLDHDQNFLLTCKQTCIWNKLRMLLNEIAFCYFNFTFVTNFCEVISFMSNYDFKFTNWKSYQTIRTILSILVTWYYGIYST